MKVYQEGDQIQINKPVATVGTFDGVHLGHQYIFKQLVNCARKINGEPVVITFWPHPRMIVHPGGKDIMILNTLEEKIELIRSSGIRHFVILPFTKEFSGLSALQFIDEYLIKRINIRGLIMGHDHRFGKDRLGNSEQLVKCAEEYGFFIEDVDAFCLNNEKISSTKIRNALFDGDITLANSMLSWNYSVSGTVETGKKIGRNLGFPTANLRPEHNYKLIPADGVYAVKVLIENKEFPGMLNIGFRPTINKGNENKSIEVHIIGFEGDLYNQNIRLVFYKRIRNEMKFDSLDLLVEQLKEDKNQVLSFFNSL